VLSLLRLLAVSTTDNSFEYEALLVERSAYHTKEARETRLSVRVLPRPAGGTLLTSG